MRVNLGSATYRALADKLEAMLADTKVCHCGRLTEAELGDGCDAYACHDLSLAHDKAAELRTAADQVERTERAIKRREHREARAAIGA